MRNGEEEDRDQRSAGREGIEMGIRNWKDPAQRGSWARVPQFIIQNLNFTIAREACIASYHHFPVFRLFRRRKRLAEKAEKSIRHAFDAIKFGGFLREVAAPAEPCLSFSVEL